MRAVRGGAPLGAPSEVDSDPVRDSSRRRGESRRSKGATRRATSPSATLRLPCRAEQVLRAWSSVPVWTSVLSLERSRGFATLSLPVRHPGGRLCGRCSWRIVTVVEVGNTGSLPLALSEAEREALLRVLYVVKDNFWLDDVEEAMLERLLEPLANTD